MIKNFFFVDLLDTYDRVSLTTVTNYTQQSTFVNQTDQNIFTANPYMAMRSESRFTSVLALFSGVILICFVGAVMGGPGAAVYLLPLSGLFMSVIYPSINSKGISCFPKSEHGAVAGVILFFTCLSAVLGPLAMGAISDGKGHPKYGFILASAFAGLLFVSLLLNWISNPTRRILHELDATEYHVGETERGA